MISAAIAASTVVLVLISSVEGSTKVDLQPIGMYSNYSECFKVATSSTIQDAVKEFEAKTHYKYMSKLHCARLGIDFFQRGV